jgi:hypothetical protein
MRKYIVKDNPHHIRKTEVANMNVIGINNQIPDQQETRGAVNQNYNVTGIKKDHLPDGEFENSDILAGVSHTKVSCQTFACSPYRSIRQLETPEREG